MRGTTSCAVWFCSRICGFVLGSVVGRGLSAVVKMNPASESFEHNDDVEVDQLLQSVPDSILDNRSYYWPNFVHPRFIHHEKYRFIVLLSATNDNAVKKLLCSIIHRILIVDMDWTRSKDYSTNW